MKDKLYQYYQLQINNQQHEINKSYNSLIESLIYRIKRLEGILPNLWEEIDNLNNETPTGLNLTGTKRFD